MHYTLHITHYTPHIINMDPTLHTNNSEFRRAVYLVQLELSPPTQFAFDFDVNVSVFETTIRILGGLLSAHLMAVDPLLGIYSQDNGGEWVGYPTVNGRHAINLNPFQIDDFYNASIIVKIYLKSMIFT